MGVLVQLVSIHAPGRGATCIRSIGMSSVMSFNSRTREGCDNHRSLQSYDRGVSIHAPGRGATGREIPYQGYRETVSIHAPGRGATACIPCKRAPTEVSIHAPGRGATRLNSSTIRGKMSFNSRTREGCDARRVRRKSFSIAFQFTHPGGVRPRLHSRKMSRFYVSIHAPGRGATAKQ